MISWFLSWVSDGLTALKWWVGKEWIRLGHPKFGCEFEVLWFTSVQPSCLPVSMPTSPLVASVLRHLTVVGPVVVVLIVFLLQANSTDSCLCTNQLLFFLLGCSQKWGPFDVCSPEWNCWVTGNEWTIFWLLLHVARLSLERPISFRLSPATYKCTYYPTSWPTLKFIILIYLCCFNREM